ncbi:serine/threonine dehydratase [Aquipseudomonas alcaligenes]|uniref:Serine/threonine dehydratase n=1 Tax=Aquipseudomonas alcaligenes TaxID=43263 RepID=A0A2V4KJT6_AQUAC|nr:threonine/serine dehydratase [Pseudomonas alcaligenes]PYC20259.1 serine/threonine dehydratase [Pseudomonas alcaligenes]
MPTSNEETLSQLYSAIEEAHHAIRPQVALTPLSFSPGLSAQSGAQVYLKCEHLQHTGSFKFRGASNKLRLLDEESRRQGVITASSGNHGQALALAGQHLGVPVTVYTASYTSPIKLDAMRRFGANVITLDTDSLGAELEASKQSQATGKPFISPYNDLEIIAGQGTIGMEIIEQLPELDAIFVAVGGGGMISGIAAVLKKHNPAIRVVGCWPEVAPTMQRSIEAGEIIQMEEGETISDGTAGGVEPGAITLPLCQRLIDETVLVSEEEIHTAMREVARHERWIIEGAAGVAVAGLLKQSKACAGQRVAAVVCGRNIMLDQFLSAVR